MRGDLADHLDAKSELLVGIFVDEHAFRVARALEIDAEAEIVVIGEPGITSWCRGSWCRRAADMG
jgi:hypothetical protein